MAQEGGEQDGHGDEGACGDRAGGKAAGEEVGGEELDEEVGAEAGDEDGAEPGEGTIEFFVGEEEDEGEQGEGEAGDPEEVGLEGVDALGVVSLLADLLVGGDDGVDHPQSTKDADESDREVGEVFSGAHGVLGAGIMGGVLRIRN